MPRPERVLAGSGPVEALAAGLRELRQRAGGPGYRELASRAGFSAAALSNAAGGRQLPSLAVTLAYARACGGDPVVWEERWRRAAAECAASRPTDDADEPPYRGLLCYGSGDHDRFFGRERIVARLVGMLQRQRFVAVFGASGSGKSSLLRAGLIPALAGRASAGAAVLVTPGRDPLAALAEAPVDAAGVLVVDQFEELFTQCADPSVRTAFVDRIAALVSGPDSRVAVVLGVRADFYARCTELPVLAGLLAGANVPVPPLTDDELRDVIAKPAALAGLSVERALITQIMAEVSGQPGALPLVSHALLETWRLRRGDVLGVAGYTAAGGVAGAVAKTAEALYEAFDDSQRETTRQVFVRLVAFGEGVEDTRRRVSRDELDLPGIDVVLERLAAARLVVLDAKAGPTHSAGSARPRHKDSVEIAHEALIRAWPRLRGWLSTDREGLRTHRQLSDAAQSWMSLERDPGALYRGARLAVANEWAARTRGSGALTAVEQRFLDASNDLADRERLAAARHNRQLRYLSVGLAVLLVVALGAGAVALVQRRDAVAQRQLAISRQLAAESLGLAHTEPDTAMLLATQAYRIAPTGEARSALLSMSIYRAHLGKLVGHAGAVSQVVFTPDGSRLLSVGRDQTLSVWDPGRRTRTAVLTGHNTWLTAAAVSHDGHIAATGGHDGKVAIWDLDRRVRFDTLYGHTSRIRDIAFSPDGRFLAVSAHDGTVILWNVARRARVTTLSGHTKAVPTVAFSPNGRLLATASDDATVVLWDLGDTAETKAAAKTATLTGHVSGVSSVAFSPDGSTLATGGGDTTVIVWDVATRTRRTTFNHRKSGWVMALAFSPDGRSLATAGDDSAVLVWDTTHQLLRARLTGPRTAVYTVAFNPRTGMLAAGGEDGAIFLWDPMRSAVVEHDDLVNDVEFSPDGRTVATASVHRTTLWNTDDRTLRAVRTDEHVFVNDVTFDPAGRTVLFVTQPSPYVAAGTTGNTFMLWNPTDGTEVPLTGHTGPVLDVALSPDGRTAATASVDQTVIIWDLATRQPLATLAGHAAIINGVSFSPDGRLLATAGHDNLVKLWDTATGQVVATLTGHTSWVRTAIFSPDGRLLATESHDQTVMLWDVASRTRLATITDHRDAEFNGIAISPDGRTLAYTSGESTVILWDVARRAIAAQLTGHAQQIHAMAFSPDGDTLATVSADQTLMLWDTNPERATAHICAAVARNLTRGEWLRYLPGMPHTDTCPAG
jgi:WD40 repeat protein